MYVTSPKLDTTNTQLVKHPRNNNKFLQPSKIQHCHNTSVQQYTISQHQKTHHPPTNSDIHQYAISPITKSIQTRTVIPFNKNKTINWIREHITPQETGHIANLRSFFNRWRNFNINNKLKMNAHSGLLFVGAMAASSTTKCSTVLQNIKYLNTIINKLDIPQEPLDALNRKNLAKNLQTSDDFLREEEEKALPATKEAIEQILSAAPNPIWKLGIWIARKTASRWAEIMELHIDNLTWISNTEILVTFLVTKVRTKNRIDHLIIIKDDNAQMYWKTILELRKTGNTQPWRAITTETLAKFLSTITPTPTDILTGGPNCKHHYTAHSIKSGALVNAIQHITKNPSISASALATLAKHAQTHSILPTTTVGYLKTCRIQLARMNQTHLLTAIL